MAQKECNYYNQNLKELKKKHASDQQGGTRNNASMEEPQGKSTFKLLTTINSVTNSHWSLRRNIRRLNRTELY